MRKIGLLLNEVTLIDFRLLWSLLGRYKIVSVTILSSILLSVPYFFFSQSAIHEKKVYFKIFQHESKPQTANSLQHVTTARGLQLKKEEVIAIVTNYGFINSMVGHLLKHPKFSTLDFDSPLANKKIAAERLRNCDNDSCRAKYLPELVAPLYGIDSEVGTGRTILTILAKTSDTTLAILEAFKYSLEDVRLKDATDLLMKETDQIEELAQNTRKHIESVGGFERIAKSEFLNATIEQIKSEVSGLQARLSKEAEVYNYQKISLEETINVSSTELKSNDLMSYENYLKLSQRISEIRQNIAAIKSMPEDKRSSTDNLILARLEEELNTSEKENKNFKEETRIIGGQGKFVNNQLNGQSRIEFDHKVSSHQLKKIQNDLNNARKKLDALYVQKMKLENEFIAVKPDLEYLKQIEERLVAMKLKKMALSSEVYFEPYDLSVRVFKKNSLIKIMIFGIMFTLFVLFFILVFIFLIDDRIFDENELQKFYKDLQVIGHAPQFESEGQ